MSLPAAGSLAACRSGTELRPADENGLRLPRGFRSRIVARSRQQVVPASPYRWHGAPDGGATFAMPDGGWVYVSNSELDRRNGGVGALRFNAAGDSVDAYPILTGTSRNCAGGATPWGSWLSCEEIDTGLVYECDPTGVNAPNVWPALGRFNHEAAAVDRDGRIYLTEDKPDGCLYRFTAADTIRDIKGIRPDLSGGRLEAMLVDTQGNASWREIPDPGVVHNTPTRYQVFSAARFRGGEGIAYLDGKLYFATKIDNRVWEYDIDLARVRMVYDAASPVLSGVDNVTTLFGHIVIAEDGGDMQIVLLSPAGAVRPLLQVTGQPLSEITGPAFDPRFKRLYFSSQRGVTGAPGDGITYEVTGDFAALLN
ncbi:MAG TPA: alkaline phosphatase PhoX [Gammaproteobacteria bacterium]|nr:alkaline phosphatase PhoX [Gammaproteobacteria bacterium]